MSDQNESAPLGFGRKRGENNQAVGRSRGGRNTKMYAIGDAEGRLPSILLTGGEAHDCPAGTAPIEATKPAKDLLGDKAYDSRALRERLNARGTRATIPNRRNREKEVQV